MSICWCRCQHRGVVDVNMLVLVSSTCWGLCCILMVGAIDWCRWCSILLLMLSPRCVNTALFGVDVANILVSCPVLSIFAHNLYPLPLGWLQKHEDVGCNSLYELFLTQNLGTTSVSRLVLAESMYRCCGVSILLWMVSYWCWFCWW